MKATENFKQTIRQFLEKRGSNDPLFARIVTKPGKNMDDCVAYILDTVYKSKCNGFTDDEIYNMAIHYFDEDNLQIGKFPNCNVVVNHKVELTEEEKEAARKKAFEELKDEIKAKAKKQPAKPVKPEESKEAPVSEVKENTLF